MLYCQNCVYRDHPVMLTTYLRNREPAVKCSGCGYIAAELALVVKPCEHCHCTTDSDGHIVCCKCGHRLTPKPATLGRSYKNDLPKMRT